MAVIAIVENLKVDYYFLYKERTFTIILSCFRLVFHF